jgi:ABC-type branched-subunit amino acid transport system ATPase component
MANNLLRARGADDRVSFSKGEALLRIEGLSKAFGGHVVLNELCAELHHGEVVLLRGDNGSGKTTLLNILTGNLEPDAGTIHLLTNGGSERFSFPRRWWQDLNPFDHFTPEQVASKGVGRTWQDIRLFATQSLLENVAVSHPRQKGENPLLVLLNNFAVRRQESVVLEEARSLLARLALNGRFDFSAESVSASQAKLVGIARAIQAGARILLLDEPLAGLDALGIHGTMALLKQLAHDHKVTLVIVEHVFNIPRVLELADTVWTLKSGAITVQEPEEVAAEFGESGSHVVEDTIRRIAGSNGVIRHVALPRGGVLTTISRHSEGSSEVVLEVRDLAVKRGKRLIIGTESEDNHVDGISFQLKKGEIAFLQAPNGWGKTTLLEAISGVIPALHGMVRVGQESLDHQPVWQRARSGLTLVQARNHVFPALTVRESLSLAGVSVPPKGLEHLLGKHVSDLSGGEKQKVALACAQGHPCQCLMMDEPFLSLDSRSIRDCVDGILASKQQSVLVTVPSITRGD